jgi:hypothetical protein
VFAAIGQNVFLDAAFEQIVRGLRRVQWRDGTKGVHLGRTEIAHSDRPDLARLKQVGHRCRGFPDGRVRIGPVHLVDVDDVGLQATQRILDLLDDPCPAPVAERLMVLPVEADFGRDHGALATATLRERLADNRLRPAEPVDRSGIDKIDSMIKRGMDGRDGVSLIGSAPHPSSDCPGAERDARNFQIYAGYLRCLHGTTHCSSDPSKAEHFAHARGDGHAKPAVVFDRAMDAEPVAFGIQPQLIESPKTRMRLSAA